MVTIFNEYKSLFATIKNDNNCSWHKEALYRMVNDFVRRHNGLLDDELLNSMRDSLFEAISEIE
jgi:hypothetical protein